MATYEDHIDNLEKADGVPHETVEAAQDALSFVAGLQDLYVTQGVLSEEAPIDCAVLENLIDAYHGELAAAALFLSEYDSFKGVPDLLRGTAKTMEDPEGVVPHIVKRGFERLANRVEKAREQRIVAFRALEEKGNKQE